MMTGLELYIHIPFCAKKCNYCDFLSFRTIPSVHTAYIGKLKEEIAYCAAKCEGRSVSSIYIGGGTPSVLEAELIESVMNMLFERFCVEEDAEISIECNPGSTLRHKFAAYKRCGINRLSIGLQSANNDELRTLGRIHSFEEFLKCYQGARMEGFNNINVDLINCIPGQTASTWKKTLKNIVMLKPEHISVYNLIIEPGTPFFRMNEDGLLELPDEETDEEIDEFTRSYLKQTGYERYEISNWSKPSYECRHNIGYWTEREYLGMGLGAASFFDGMRFSDTSDLQRYLELDFSDPDIEKKLHIEKKELSREEEMEEFMFLGLRMTRGISATDFLVRFKVKVESVYGDKLKKFTDLKLMEKEGYRYRLTERGMDVSNVIMSEFLLSEENDKGEISEDEK